MKCSNCGAECTGTTCKFCGASVYQKSADIQLNLRMHYINFLYILDCILLPPAKVMAIIWSITWLSSFASNYEEYTSGHLVTILFGYFVYCGMADLIYMALKKRYLNYKIKILQKKMSRYQKLKDHFAPLYEHSSIHQNENIEYANTSIHETSSDLDPLFAEAGRFFIEKGNASIGMLQRVFKIGFSRASHIVDQLFEYGVVGEEVGTTPRKVLIDIEQFEILLCKIKYGYTPIIPPNKNNVSPVIQKNINIDGMNGHEFEEYCATILENNGFTDVIVTQGSGDHGIDILAEKDDISYAIQCKCYSGNIGNAAVQQALAGKKFYQKDIAVVLTNQYFTQQAKEEAKVFGVKLWDRDKLHDLIQKSNS